MAGLLPFSFVGDEQPVLALSTEASLSQTRKRDRDIPTSESLIGGSNKRFHEFTDETPSDLWNLRSSPPLPPQNDTDEDEPGAESLTQDEGRAFSFTGSFFGTLNPRSAAHTASQTTITSAESDVTIAQKSASFSRSGSYVVSTALDDNATPEDRAKHVIRRAVDHGDHVVKLDNLNLEEVPGEIADLDNLVCIAENNSLTPKLQIFLYRNRIRTLPAEIFNVSSTTALFLRNNKLTEIPPAIKRLSLLEELSVASNYLEYLPSELLDMRQLRVAIVHPNRFLPIPAGSTRTSDGSDKLETTGSVEIASTGIVNKPTTVVATSSEHIAVYRSNKWCRSLAETCLEAIARNVASDREAASWELPSQIEARVRSGIKAHRFSVACGVCQRFQVHGIGHTLEWRNGFMGTHDGVVFRRNICSFSCYDKWKTDNVLVC